MPWLFTYAHPMCTMNLQPWPDFGENVRGGGKIFREGATMISPSRQRVEIKKIRYFYNFHIIMFAFYIFLSSLCNCLLKSILLIILLVQVLKISGEVQSHSRCAPSRSSPQNPALPATCHK